MINEIKATVEIYYNYAIHSNINVPLMMTTLSITKCLQ